MKYPFVKQTDLKDCGVCCLLMLVRYYGGGVSKEYLREITNTTKEGVNAYSLIEGAKVLGFSGYGVKGKVESIEKEFLPCIAHVTMRKSYQHFIVIYKIDCKRMVMTIADPAGKGIQKISFKEFRKISTEQFLFLAPQKKIMYVKENQILKNLILGFLAENKSKVIMLLLLSFIITILNILFSFQFKILMEYVISYQTIYNLLSIALIFAFIILIKEISSYYRNVFVNHINHQLDRMLFSNVYHHILSLPYLYYKNRTTGEIITRMEDLSNIRNVISKLLVTVFMDIILASVSFIVLFYISKKLTLILMIIILLIFFIMLLFRPFLEKRVLKSKEKASNLNSFLVETIGAVETIKNQNIQNFIEKNFLYKYCKYNKNSLSYNYLFILEQFLKDLVDQFGTFFIMIFGSYLVVKQELDISILITFITLMSYLLKPVKNMLDLDLSLKEAKVSFKRIHELYEIKEENIKLDSQKLNRKLKGKIESNHMKYSYNGKELLLKNINLKINPGDRVLIYGNSGSGKSTIAKILSKQIETEQNMLFYDKKDSYHYSLDCIRNEICYISQQETIFTDSIYQNIVLDKRIDYNDFLNIAKCCVIDEFVQKDILAYHKLLEENGFNLSGGQRQRIILARALLKDAQIYILDESLNEVDVKTERKILKQLFQRYKDKTFIIISHRFHNQDLFRKKYRIENGVSYEE